MNKTISTRSYLLLNRLITEDKRFFTMQDAENILSTSRPEAVRKLLSDMVKRGLVLRLKGGLYNLIPYEIQSNEYSPNWHLAAEALVRPNKYYIGFYTALDIHGLITQPSLIEYIVTEKQIIPKHQKLQNIRFEFITIKSKLFFGYEKTWIDDFNKVYCSDLEKTIIDCLYMPHYSGGIIEIIKAIDRSRSKLDLNKMDVYIQKFNVQAVAKRLGFILENFSEFNYLTNQLSRKVTNTITFLDPSQNKNGKYNSRWKLIDNVGIESALHSIWT